MHLSPGGYVDRQNGVYSARMFLSAAFGGLVYFLASQPKRREAI